MQCIKVNSKWTFIDDIDFPSVGKYRWRIRKDGRVDGKVDRKRILLHRFIMRPSNGEQVDHKDGNPLNNIRSNLRICTNAQNQQNSRKRIGCRTGFKGVTFRNGHFELNVNGKFIRNFLCEMDAAKAYDIVAQQLYGEFSRPNFPNGISNEDFKRISNLLIFKKEGSNFFTSKYKGVGFFSPTKKWRARIRLESKIYKTLGYFKTEKEAANAVQNYYEHLSN